MSNVKVFAIQDSLLVSQPDGQTNMADNIDSYITHMGEKNVKFSRIYNHTKFGAGIAH